MAANHKLTNVIRGRQVTGIDVSSGNATVHFDDGSTMTVLLGGDPPPSPPTGRVLGVRQQGRTLDIDYEGGTTLELTTAEATSSVMVRDAKETMEYAD
jgi:hypothetical protein